MTKHIFSKEELDTMDKDARLALLSGHRWVTEEGVFRPDDPIPLLQSRRHETSFDCVARAAGKGYMNNYSQSLTEAWWLLPISVNWNITFSNGNGGWVCLFSYEASAFWGMYQASPQSALIAALYGADGYWRKQHAEHWNKMWAHGLELGFEQWMQTK